MKRGDLIYIPSKTSLRQFDETGVFITRELQLEEPTVGVCSNNKPNSIQVWLGQTGGQSWWVAKQNVYKYEELVC